MFSFIGLLVVLLVLAYVLWRYRAQITTWADAEDAKLTAELDAAVKPAAKPALADGSVATLTKAPSDGK